MPVRRGRKGKQGGGSKQAASAAMSSPVKYVSSTELVPSVTVAESISSLLPQPSTQNTSTDAPMKQQQQQQQQIVLTGDKRRGVYECDYCGGDVSQTPRIRCAVCVDFDVCCECFITIDPITAMAQLRAAQAVAQAEQQQQQQEQLPHGGFQLPPLQPPPHDPLTHGYRVCDSTRYPIFPLNASTSVITGVSSIGITVVSNSKPVPGSSSRKRKTVTITTANSGGNEMDTADEGQHMEGVDVHDKKDDSGIVDSSEGVNIVMPSETSEPTAADNHTTRNLTETVIMQAGDDAKTIWTAEEDLRLLRGIETHGLGNWTDISESVAGQGSQGKTPKRCMERYFDDFMGRYGHILPPYTLIGESTSSLSFGITDDADDDAETAANAVDVGGTSGNSTSTPTKDSSNRLMGEPSALLSTTSGEAIRSSKRRSTMFRASGSFNNSGTASAKKYIAVPTESLPEYQKVRPQPYLPILHSGPVVLGQEVGRDQATKAEQAYVRTIASMDTKEQVDRIRKDWELNRLNKPGGPTVLPMRPDDIPKLPGSELSGFMPRRGDFDIEYDNSAEDAIADMEFVSGESEQDRQLKLAVLAIYNSKLDEREKRKRFILSRKLYDYRTYQEEHNKLPRDERDLVLRMRIFERFHAPEEHRIFINDLLKAKRLRKEIAKLQMYRRMGIRTLLEAEKYELDKARRLFHKNAAEEKDVETAKLTMSTSLGGTTGTGVVHTESSKVSSSVEDNNELSSQYWKQYRTTDRKVRRSVNRGDTSRDNHKISIEIDDTAGVVAAKSVTSVAAMGADEAMQEVELTTDMNDAMDVETTLEIEDQSIRDDGGATEPTTREDVQSDTIHPTADDLSHLPGYELLSSREIDLIRSINIKPAQYNQIKKALIYESLTHGFLDDNVNSNKKPKPRSGGTSSGGSSKKIGSSVQQTLVMIDIERRGKIIDFVVRAGWISTHFGKSVIGSALSS